MSSLCWRLVSECSRPPAGTGSHQLYTSRATEGTRISSQMSCLIEKGPDTYETDLPLSTFRRDIRSVGIRLSRAQKTCRPNTWVSINPELTSINFVNPPVPSVQVNPPQVIEVPEPDYQELFELLVNTEPDQGRASTECQDIGHSDHLTETESATKDDCNQAKVAGPDSDKLLLLRWRAASGYRAD